MEADIASQAVGLGSNTDFSLISLFLRADIIVKSVIIILIVCSIYSWAVIIEKFRLFKKINKSSEEFEDKFWNSKSAELAKAFIDKNYNIHVYDSIVNSNEVNNIFGIKLSKLIGHYDVIIIAVSHKFLSNKSIDLLKHIKKSTKIFDISGKYRNMFSSESIKYWSL